MKLYMIRHGQSEANFAERHSGWHPYHLTEKGRAQALELSKRLEGVTFDKIYTSDLLRAMETCELACPGAPFEATSVIREIDVGELAGLPFTHCDEMLGQAYHDNRRELNFAPYRGENKEMFHARIRDFIDRVAAEPHERVAAFCHAGVIHNALEIITGLPVNPKHFACNNCGIFIFEYIDGYWRLSCWNYAGL